MFHKNVALTQIIAQGELYEDDKLLKKSVQNCGKTYSSKKKAVAVMPTALSLKYS